MGLEDMPMKVLLSLENSIVPEDRLRNTPSMQDGLCTEDEMDIRLLSCEMIQHAGVLLRLPQVAMATAQVLFQRYFYRKSLVKNSYEHTAMACVFLAAKIEEAPRRIRDVINVFHHIKQFKTGRSFDAMSYIGNTYYVAKNGIITAERRVLRELGFCCHVKHPHKLITTYLQILEHEKQQKLVQRAWNYMNDSLRSNVFVRFRIETIACACIHLAALQLKISLPSNPPWYWLFDANLEDIQMVGFTIMALYERKERPLAELEEILAKTKKALTTNGSIAMSSANSPAVNLTGSPSSNVNSPVPLSSQKQEISKLASQDDAPVAMEADEGGARSLAASPEEERTNGPSDNHSRDSGSASGDSGTDSSSSEQSSNSERHRRRNSASASSSSSGHSESDASERQRSPTPDRNPSKRSRSPNGYRTRSPLAYRTRSPRRHSSKSPRRHSSRSPRRHSSPRRRRSRSPYHYKSNRSSSPWRRDRDRESSKRWRDRPSSRYSSHSSRRR